MGKRCGETRAILKIGWPAEDLAGYAEGEPMDLELDTKDWSLREYQKLAVDRFNDLGSGVVVLPCGAGKTLVGAAAMAEIKTNTLILVTNSVSARQWKHELINRTTLTEEQIAEYSVKQRSR
jgi:DNA or RNA helicases of superfamily II